MRKAGKQIPSNACSCRNGFSLLELVTVLAIISILMVLAAPAVQGLIDTAAHREAVSVILGTLDQARMVAVTSGRNVYVVFERYPMPEQDAVIVLCDGDEGNPLIPITRRTKFLREIKLLDPDGLGNIFKEGLPKELAPSPVIAGSLADRFGVIAFTPEGTIWHPVAPKNSFIFFASDCKRAEPSHDARAHRIVLSRLLGRGVWTN